MMTTDGGAQAVARTERQMLEELLDWCHDLSGTVEQDEEIEQVRAWVDGLAAQVAALTAEREKFRVAVEHILVAHLGGWKPDGSGWYDYYLCECGARASTREAVQHIVDCPLATTPPAGTQEIAPEASEPMEQCEWCGRQYPRSEMNTMPWPDDEHTRRICDRCVDEPN